MALNPLKTKAVTPTLHSTSLSLRVKPRTPWNQRTSSLHVLSSSSTSHLTRDPSCPQTWRPSKRPQYQKRSHSMVLQRPNRRLQQSIFPAIIPGCGTAHDFPLTPCIKRSIFTVSGREIKVYPPPPSARAHCKDPIAHLTGLQLAELDPTSARTRLFNASNPEAAKVGDILLVRTRSGDSFAGVCINIRRRGVDTAILLRNQLTRVGVEMWFKIYSPNVVGIEVVERRPKRARRARLYYMRNPKHDRGSVENVVSQYLRQRAWLRSGEKSGQKGEQGAKGKGKDKKT